MPTQGSIKPTKSNKYSPEEKKIVTSLKDDVGEIDLPIPKKFVAGDSIEFFDDAGRKVKR